MIETHGLSMTSAHYARMGKPECDQIHNASLEILERVGVEVHDEQARETLVKGGARADGLRVRIPEHVVARALDVVPRRMTLYDRHGQVAMRAWGYRTYYGGGSDCLNVLDHRTGERRRPVLKDVVEAATLMDGLPEISFVMSAFLPEDVDQRIYDRYQMEAMLNHTSKPIVFVTPDFEGCVAAVEMCEAVAGGAEAFQRRPFATCYINVTSGLVANAEAMQKCTYLAEKGLPQLYIPLNAGGVNSPTTTAGCMASMNAGTLLGIVLAQLVREGSPVAVPGWNGGPYNLKTMVGNYVLADEQGVPTSLGKYYGLPVFGLGGCTDAKVLDQQCGAEVALSLFTALIHGANVVHDVGFMDAGLQGSLQVIAIANDLIGWLRAATAGVLVNDETLALDVIDELGPTGDYLGHPHTLRHFREPYYARLADKGTYSQWVERGALTMEQRAARQVDEILASHTPEALPADVQRDVRRIVEREQEWINGRES
ncbi:MAG TPA: trimethylamine methyltransferase family protein [Anaerolineae bacterium]|nr:trimethylamine methyltransferase family protein [Anaerolineae bacterium]